MTELIQFLKDLLGLLLIVALFSAMPLAAWYVHARIDDIREHERAGLLWDPMENRAP